MQSLEWRYYYIAKLDYDAMQRFTQDKIAYRAITDVTTYFRHTIMVATDVILLPVCTKPGVKHFKPMKIAYFLYWPFKHGCQLITVEYNFPTAMTVMNYSYI